MVKVAHAEEVLEIPDSVKLKLEGKQVIVEGKRGKITKDLGHARVVNINRKDKQLVFSVEFPRKRERALLRALIAHVENMIIGVTKGFTYKMKLVYAHFPFTVEVKGDQIIVANFLGERGMRVAKKVGDVKVQVTKDDLILSGNNKDDVSQTCSNLHLLLKIRKKDPRIFQDGLYMFEKLIGDEVVWKIT
ncbi:MAG: 50S ribosomal protein L6P [Promethearchaeota archaeon CR_4]|nr:ribosomal protein L6 [uncultured bacterium]OLS16170.1 MAG: 50S ribosomal protein L6P [Candidatus Lokiarchaeota archaeon CR_4]